MADEEEQSVPEEPTEDEEADTNPQARADDGDEAVELAPPASTQPGADPDPQALTQPLEDDPTPPDPPRDPGHTATVEVTSVEGEPPMEEPPTMIVEDGQDEPSEQPDSDGWGEYDDSGSNGWSSVAGESRVELRPTPAEKEYSRRDTDVYGPDGQPLRSAAAHLVCTQGADQGADFPLEQREITIGRGPGNSIILKDPSVSRFHARLRRDGDTFQVIDLDSGNGTFINGERQTRGTAGSGDVLAFGNATFRLLDEGEVFKNVDASGAAVLPQRHLPWRVRLAQWPHAEMALRYGVLVVIALLMVANAAALRRNRGPALSRDDVFTIYQQGIEAFNNRAWDDANGKFAVVLQVAPGFRDADAYLEAIAQQREHHEVLSQAVQSKSQGRLAEAYAKLALLQNSTFAQEAATLKQSIEQELAGLFQQAQHELRQGNVDASVIAMEQIAAVRPLTLEERRLRLRAMHAKGMRPPTADATATVRARPVARAQREPALTPLASGDFGGAIDKLKSSASPQAQAMLGRVTQLRSLYEEGLALHRAKRGQAAVQRLEPALESASNLVGRDAPFTKTVARKLADMYYLVGIEDYLGGKLATAYSLFRKAVEVSPGHGPSGRKLAELAQKAEEIYNEGYVAKDMDPTLARSKWELVTQIVPPGHEYHRKAKERLSALGR